MSVNKVILLGNVGKDPDVRYPQQGQCMASFTLATSERYSTANGPAERTEWHNIVVWGKQAEIVEKYVRKGTKLYIEGKLRTRQWEDRNAIKRYDRGICRYLRVFGQPPAGRRSTSPRRTRKGSILIPLQRPTRKASEQKRC